VWEWVREQKNGGNILLRENEYETNRRREKVTAKQSAPRTPKTGSAIPVHLFSREYLQYNLFLRKSPSRMLCCVALVKTDVLEERSSSIIRVGGISELETKLAITSN
jgi:hypothetical protein